MSIGLGIGLRIGAGRILPLVPVVMRLIGEDWFADSDPEAVADGWWIDNPDYPATSDEPYIISDAATEGYQAYIRGGQLYIDTGVLVPVEIPVGAASLLLDSYTGAGAAYSLRSLSSSFAGSAIRVRRSSDNAEQDIGFSSGALDTATLLSFVGAGEGFVTTWYDQSGNANNAVQATQGRQPRIVMSGALVTSGGEPAIDFDGTSGTLAASGVTPSGGLLAMLVAEPDANDNSYISQGSSRATGASSDFDLFGTGTVLRSRIANSAGTHADVDHATLPSTGAIHLLGFAAEGTSQLTRLDGGGSSGSLVAGTLASRFALNIGGDLGSSIFDGRLSEAVIWPSDQSANRAAIESEIMTHYSIS